MDFFKLYIRYGLDKHEVAKLLGRDLEIVESMDPDTISNLILEFVRRSWIQGINETGYSFLFYTGFFRCLEQQAFVL